MKGMGVLDSGFKGNDLECETNKSTDNHFTPFLCSALRIHAIPNELRVSGTQSSSVILRQMKNYTNIKYNAK